MNPPSLKSCLAAGLLLAGLPSCLPAQTSTPTGTRLQALGTPSGILMGSDLVDR